MKALQEIPAARESRRSWRLPGKRVLPGDPAGALAWIRRGLAAVPDDTPGHAALEERLRFLARLVP